MAIGHCLRGHGTKTKYNFDSVTRALEQIGKKNYRARGCVLSPDF